MQDHTTLQSSNEIPYGYCHCGCGQKTRLAPQTHKQKGWVKNQPVSFIAGHNIFPYRKTLAESFWLYCTKGNPDDCWLWNGPLSNGYGKFGWHKKYYFAHRVAYEFHYGTILTTNNPLDTCVCHTCDTPRCCNPAHLFVGSTSDNARDMVAKGRQVNPKGSSHPQSKLTEDIIIAIRQRSASGESYATLAKYYGTTKPNIGYIVNRKAWKHVP